VSRTARTAELERYKDYSEVMKIKETSALKINYGKRDYETPDNTNVVGDTLAPQSPRSIEWSLVMLLGIIASLIVTSVVLLLVSQH